MLLTGQVGLVTGAGRGIGAAIACGLAAEGMAVAAVARTQAQVAETVAAIEAAGGRAVALVGDVANADDVRRMTSLAVERLGPVDLLVNNAGRAPVLTGPLWKGDAEDWWGVLEVNLRGPMLACHAVLPSMLDRGSGRVVTIGSLAGANAWGDGSAYAVSKAAVSRLTDSLADSLRDTGVCVFDLNPGLVRTSMTDAHPELFGHLSDDDFDPPELAAAAVVRIATGDLDALTGRMLTAEDPFDDLVAAASTIGDLDARALRLRTFGSADPLSVAYD
jgi:3-oxoacyl-[acyl-carrier protein] reductase